MELLRLRNDLELASLESFSIANYEDMLGKNLTEARWRELLTILFFHPDLSVRYPVVKIMGSKPCKQA